jgi:hypothetical protein
MSSSAKFKWISSGVIQVLTSKPKVPKTNKEERVVIRIMPVGFEGYAS